MAKEIWSGFAVADKLIFSYSRSCGELIKEDAAAAVARVLGHHQMEESGALWPSNESQPPSLVLSDRKLIMRSRWAIQIRFLNGTASDYAQHLLQSMCGIRGRVAPAE